MKHKAFTLLELLIVIAIIGLLAGVTLVQFQGAQQKAKIANALRFSDTLRSSMQPDMVAWYALDGDATDRYKDQHDGIIHGNPVFIDDGIVNGALEFDGSDYIQIPNSPDFNIGTEGFTWEAWIKPSSFLSEYNMFMGKHLPYFNVRHAGTLHMSMRAGGSQRSVHGSTQIPLGEWHHAVATYDKNGYMRVYLDGREDGKAGPWLPASNYSYDLYIGQWGHNSYYFTGTIDEVRIYSSALPTSVIRQHYVQEIKKHQNLAIIK